MQINAYKSVLGISPNLDTLYWALRCYRRNLSERQVKCIELIEDDLLKEARAAGADSYEAPPAVQRRLCRGVRFLSAFPEGPLVKQQSGKGELAELIGSHRKPLDLTVDVGKFKQWGLFGHAAILDCGQQGAWNSPLWYVLTDKFCTGHKFRRIVLFLGHEAVKSTGIEEGVVCKQGNEEPGTRHAS